MTAVETLTTRVDFLRLRKGRRRNTPAFLLQSLPNGGDTIRVGLTVTKKMGNAVRRNRIKRRLREAVRQVLPVAGQPGMDYVLLAREQAATLPFDRLLDDLRRALVDPRNPASGRS